MKILINFECSGTIREAMRARGHDAWSCDLKPAEDGSRFHYQDDGLAVMRDGHWDMMIAHPPCTFLNSAGMHWTVRGLRDPQLTEDAVELFRQVLSAPIARICVENPVGIISTRIRPPDQYVQPYQFGDDASKKTGLWLVGLPLLRPTRHIAPRMVNGLPRWANQTDSGQNRLAPSAHRAADRARTYGGIAQAMAEQWA